MADEGDRIIVRPVPDDPVAVIVGKYVSAPASEELRRRARLEELEQGGQP